ncbi:MAG: 5-(carboxyamino)imidazole ribonucleotide synthase [Proteobacteria bacterium]|nr:5-(carboxyamino)imidazole ribonucleotide synthase [Pseudomonadota bacterium]
MTPLPPGSTIGILGDGQLGRMLALAAARLGFDAAVLSPDADGPASRVAARSWVADYTDPAALEELARAADVVTFEFENVPVAAVERLEALGATVLPGRRALAVAQDRVAEKTFMLEHGLETVDFAPVDDSGSLAAALERIALPALLKTRREGYDGKGQAWIEVAEAAEAAWAEIGGGPAILEARAPFVRELSVIAARGRDGSVAIYPAGENRHEGGILRETTAPARSAPELEAQRIAETVLSGLGYVGVIGVELFELADGRLLVNEIAPRVHNTGHWTQDACQVDQFEQHVRAVAGWPLGPTEPHSAALMQNLIGEDAERWAELAADPSARLHLYAKREPRAGRKMGHVNRLQPRAAP